MKRLMQDAAKERTVNLLTEFADYCDTHNLRYYMIGGTLLGAVRHKGFIPWDDDIDVGMPRPDYRKFIELQSKNQTMDFRCIENNTSNFPFMKVIDKQTFVKQPYTIKSETSCLWVDVFPLDGWAVDERQAGKELVEWKRWHRLSVYAQVKLGQGTTKLRAFLKIPIALVAKALGLKNIARKMSRLAQKYDYESSDWVGNFAWACYGIHERVPKEWFEQRVKLPFEGHEFWAPEEWDKYLTQIYGDYMTPPPEDKRVNHNMEVWLK